MITSFENNDNFSEKIREKKLNKNEELLSESVLDPIQKYRCDAVFGPNNNEKSPKILPELRETIINLVNNFLSELDIPGIKADLIFMIGSSLGYQYKETSDFDVDVILNKPKSALKGKFSKVPKDVLYKNTSHPINIFVICSDELPFDFESKTENAYDVVKNEWIKQGSLSNKNGIPYNHLKGISEFFINGIVLQIEKAERDLQDIKKYTLLDPNKVEISESEKREAISNKLADLQMDLDALKLAHHLIFAFECEGFDGRYEFKVNIDYEASSKHFIINNLVYKYIDGYGYLDRMNSMVKELQETIKNVKDELKKQPATTVEAKNEEEAKKELEKTLKEFNIERISDDIVLYEGEYCVLMNEGFELNEEVSNEKQKDRLWKIFLNSLKFINFDRFRINFPEYKYYSNTEILWKIKEKMNNLPEDVKDEILSSREAQKVNVQMKTWGKKLAKGVAAYQGTSTAISAVAIGATIGAPVALSIGAILSLAIAGLHIAGERIANKIITNHQERHQAKKITMLTQDEVLKKLKQNNALTESRLPKDGSDPEFGVPEEKKFPLFDKHHVESAIKMFGHVNPLYERELARAIISKMKKYNIPFDSVGEENKLFKYIPASFKNEKSES